MSDSNSKSNVIDFINRQRLKNPDPNRVLYRGSYGVDCNGEIVYDTMSRPVYENGGGFVISYTAKMLDFIAKTRAGSVVRLFVYLAHQQQFANSGQFGFRCTRKYLEQVLGLDRKSVYSGLKELQDNFLIIETKVNGGSEFMVNPAYVTIGRGRRERDTEWSRRWSDHWKATGGKS